MMQTMNSMSSYPKACFAAMITTTVLMLTSSDAREGSSTREIPGLDRLNSQQARSRQARGSQSGAASQLGSVTVRRLREGTVINDQTGYFRENGDGASFVSDKGQEFGALQNLNLERVVRLLKNADEPSSIRWSVTGTVTEFSGRNYLLISRAVYKSATPPPTPDRVAR